MTIVSIKTGTDGDTRRAEISDGSLFSFRLCYLPAAFADEGLYEPGADEGRELGADELEGLRFAAACLATEGVALRLVARAEQTAFGLGRKLEKRGAESAVADAVVSRLREAGLVDDGRYARLWLESRVHRGGSSPLRLLAALRAKGVDRGDAEAALGDALDDDAELRLLGRFAPKLRRRLAGDGDARRPLAGALRREGFSSLAIERFFDE